MMVWFQAITLFLRWSSCIKYNSCTHVKIHNLSLGDCDTPCTACLFMATVSVFRPCYIMAQFFFFWISILYLPDLYIFTIYLNLQRTGTIWKNWHLLSSHICQRQYFMYMISLENVGPHLLIRYQMIWCTFNLYPFLVIQPAIFSALHSQIQNMLALLPTLCC